MILMPVVVFVGGMLLAGPYEGKASLIGLMSAIYKDGLSLKPGALLLLTWPVVLILLWAGALRLRRRLIGQENSVDRDERE